MNTTTDTVEPPSFACAPHAGHNPCSGLGGRPDIDSNVPDVHVVPVDDDMEHAVPGGLGDVLEGGPEGWRTVRADPDAVLAFCDCFPSVRTTRNGIEVGRKLIHHAADMRPSGQGDE